MRVFLAGVMQASLHGKGIVDQRYRNAIGDALLAKWPDMDVVDPLILHPNSVEYDDQVARETLFALIALATTCDLVIAYVPQASMGAGDVRGLSEGHTCHHDHADARQLGRAGAVHARVPRHRRVPRVRGHACLAGGTGGVA